MNDSILLRTFTTLSVLRGKIFLTFCLFPPLPLPYVSLEPLALAAACWLKFEVNFILNCF